METKIRAIITGATGMVGEGVLHECLLHPDVEDVLVVGRRPCGVVHPKLREIICTDFFDLDEIQNRLAGYNACYFCLGVSSIGMKEAEYYRLTYTLTLNFARTLCQVNPDVTFCYVSGGGTDSTEKGRSTWARVKGKTENDLMKLPFKHVYAFRPGYMHPTPGLKNANKFYRYVSWMYPVFRRLFPSGVCTLAELGKAMIHITLHEFPARIVDVENIVAMAKAT